MSGEIERERGLPPHSVTHFEQELVDGNGKSVRVRVTIDLGVAFEATLIRLANKARAARSRKAGAAGGAIQVTIVSDDA